MRRSLLFAVLAALLLVAGCGTSGGEESSATTDKATTTEASSTDDGDQGDDETTTTGADDEDAPSSDVTVDQLEALFPEAAEIGDGYADPEITYSSDDEDDSGEADETEQAMMEQCPKAAELDFLNEASDNPDEVRASYKTESGQEVEITLDPTPVDFTQENIDQVIEAWNDCGTVTLSDPATGDMTLDLAADPLEDLGDYGLRIRMDAEFSLFGTPATIDFRGLLFVVDGVGVGITTSGGFDNDTGASIPGDEDLLDPLGSEMADRVQTVTD